ISTSLTRKQGAARRRRMLPRQPKPGDGRKRLGLGTSAALIRRQMTSPADTNRCWLSSSNHPRQPGPGRRGDGSMDTNLVKELQRMFIDGATPSQLMQQIAKHYKGDKRLHFVIMDYFREAFGIPLLRNVVSGEDYSPDARHAHYNRDV